VDIFAADTRELYRHAKESKFLFLIVSGEGVLVHDDYREVRCAARFRKVREHGFDSSDEVGFFPCKFNRIPVRHFQRPPPSLKNIISSPENASSQGSLKFTG
jgi:hypothetical protein